MAGAPPPTQAVPGRPGHPDFVDPDFGHRGFLLTACPAPRFAGIDLLDVRRLGHAATRTGPALERRICTRLELSGLPEHPRRRLTELSRIFSIKESAVKALGGMPKGATFRDLCTGRGHCRGSVALSGEAARRAERLGVSLLAGSRELDARLLLSWVIAVAR